MKSILLCFAALIAAAAAENSPFLPQGLRQPQPWRQQPLNQDKRPDRLLRRISHGGAIQRNPAPPPGTLSATASVFSLTKNIVGAGILCLAAGMAAGQGTGFTPAVALVLFSCVLSTYSFNLVGRVVDVTGAVDFRDLWSLTVGSSSAWFVDFMIFGVAAGALLVYSMFLGDILKDVAPAAWGLDRTKAILSVTAALVPLCLLPDLSALAPISYVGIAAVLYSSWVVVKRFMDGSCAATPAGSFLEALPVAPGTGQLSVSRISLGTCILFNMLNTAFMAHTNAVRFYNELEGRSPAKFGTVVAGAFGISAVLYCLVMCAGYATFGSASAGLILNNYATSDALATLARAATGVSILGSYPLLFTSLRDVLVSTLKAAGGGAGALSALGRRCSVASSGAWTSLTLSVLSIITFLAVVITDAGFVVSVSGASFGAALIFCVPAIIFLSAKRSDKGENLLPTTKLEMSAVHLLFLFGVSAAIFGTSITCLNTFTTLLQ